MAVKRVPPKEAEALLAQGYKYVDVRSIPEFEAGHPKGAFNVPLLHFQPGRGMSPNPEFMDVVARRFAKDEKIVVGCKAGGRSQKAAELLQSAGFTNVIDMMGGYEGEGNIAGWRATGLPVETEAAGRTWDELHKP